MENAKFKTKRELIQELGLSKSTFYRLLQKKNIQSSPELLSPEAEQSLRDALGAPKITGHKENLGQIGTSWDTLGRAGSIPE